MEKVTVEGADLAKEIAKKVNEDFDNKKLPLMLAMINAIVEDKKLELNWEALDNEKIYYFYRCWNNFKQGNTF